MSKLLANPSKSIILSNEISGLTNSVLRELGRVAAKPSETTLRTFSTRFSTLLTNSLIRVGDDGFRMGCGHVVVHPDITIVSRLKRDAESHALNVVSQVVNTTANAYGIAMSAMSTKRAVSKDRADIIAYYELTNRWNKGMRFGWAQGDNRYRKSWMVSDEHDKDDLCDENEEQGPIQMNEAFISGHMEPLAHIGCNCMLVLEK